MSVLVGSSGCATARSSHHDVAVYVAVGASETAGQGADNPAAEAWPTVFFRTAGFGGRTRYANFGIGGATVQTALDKELPNALAEKPTVVTVWLNVNDIIAQVDVGKYKAQLERLVHALRRGGRARVLVANTPPFDMLPRVKPFASLAEAVAAQYNTAISAVVRSEGAELVDLHAAGLAAEQAGTAGTLIGTDGFHPSTAGHAAVAAEFVKAYRRGAKPAR
jgi:lysophospholipase L1-like esterase